MSKEISTTKPTLPQNHTTIMTNTYHGSDPSQKTHGSAPNYIDISDTGHWNPCNVKKTKNGLDFFPDPLPFLGVNFARTVGKRKSTEGHFVLIGLHLAKWSLPMSEQLCHWRLARPHLQNMLLRQVTPLLPPLPPLPSPSFPFPPILTQIAHRMTASATYDPWHNVRREYVLLTFLHFVCCPTRVMLCAGLHTWWASVAIQMVGKYPANAMVVVVTRFA